ncbi:MAG: FecR domain-containing protein [Lentisphaeraceae bacterium]|nr:FecR domain-containing protein [Lentisphaeraceae bacterium]
MTKNDFIELIQRLERNDLSEDEFAQFQELIKTDKAYREIYKSYMRMSSSLTDMASLESDDQKAWQQESSTPQKTPTLIKYSGWLAAAALLVYSFLLPKTEPVESIAKVPEIEEAQSSGVAVITDLVDVEWVGGSYTTGQALGLKPIEVSKGIVKIEFFCGATVVVEGPAKLEPLSAWKAICHTGKLRAHVPPAARGFTVNVGDTEVVDLGTEFAIDATGDEKTIQVFEGEVELNSQKLDKHSLTTGKMIKLKADGETEQINQLNPDFIGMNDLQSLRNSKNKEAYSRWLSHSKELRTDPRLLVYYDFTQRDFHRRVLENNTSHGKERSGAIVGADQEPGRWAEKSALSFKQPGDRVRIHIPGEYTSLTFMSWVKIYSLDREWNSLYLTDNYQIGENHWQIMKDGRLMFSTKIRDDFDVKNNLHVHVPNFSPSFWRPEFRGKWVHLAVRLDVEKQQVTHFVNGKTFSTHPAQKGYELTTTRFGNGEIGNWGLPNRADESYAIRNFNGAMDEFAIFADALSDEELLEIYNAGNPYK